MFEIPEDLPRDLAPLAWVLGRWQGWGMLTRPEDEEDQPLIQEVRADIVGTQMRMVTSLFLAQPRGDLDPTASASAGLDVLEAGELFREETSYWRLATPLAQVPSDGDSPRELQVTSSTTDGFGVCWVGAAMGPRITLASDVIARDASAPAVNYLHRMFGLVGGELFWTSELMEEKPADAAEAEAAEFQVEVSGRLQRVEKTASAEEN